MTKINSRTETFEINYKLKDEMITITIVAHRIYKIKKHWCPCMNNSHGDIETRETVSKQVFQARDKMTIRNNISLIYTLYDETLINRAEVLSALQSFL